MLGLSFAAVPLYDLFCRVTGFGGTTQISKDIPKIVLDKKISVYDYCKERENIAKSILGLLIFHLPLVLLNRLFEFFQTK